MLHDLTQALRRLSRARSFTVAATVTLAVGIGATTSIFTLANAVLLRPLPYADSDRLVHLWEIREKKDYGRSEASIPDYEDWKAASRTIEKFAGYSWPRVTMRLGAGAEELQAARVTDSFFDVLGVRAQLGRTFGEGEAPTRVLLSDGLWQRRFGGDRAVVGTMLRIDGKSYEVGGVLPPSFHFGPSRGAELWLPLEPGEAMLTRRSYRGLNVIARLKPGVTADVADQELDGIAARIAAEYPDSNKGTSVEVVGLREQLVGRVRPIVLVLGCAALFVLLVACVNVASLMIARVTSREHDLAILMALGATRAVLVRQLLAEAVVLSILGTAGGVAIGHWGLQALVSTVPANIAAQLPSIQHLTLDFRVLVVLAAVMTSCALLIAIAPLARLRSFGRFGAIESRTVTANVGKRRLRSTLVAVQLALSVVLLAGAILTIRSLSALLQEKTGYNPDALLTVGLALPADRYETAADLAGVQQRLLEAVGALPGVTGASLVDKLPSLGGGTIGFHAAGAAREVEANIRGAGPRYFAVMQVPLVIGRDFDDRDTPSSPRVVIVNRLLAERHLGGSDVVGRALTIGQREYQIVGVAGDERVGPLDQPATPVVYYAASQSPSVRTTLAIRTTGESLVTSSVVVQAIRQIDSGIAIGAIAPMRVVLASSPQTFYRRVSMVVITGLAAIALFLAMVGVYAVIADSVATRRKEIAIRISCGAEERRIALMILRESFVLAGAGAAGGLAVAFLVTRLMEAILFGVNARDPFTFAMAPALLIVTAVAASLIPAYRAMRVDPILALRND